MTDFDPTLPHDYRADDPAKRVNDTFPGSNGSGMIETVKRSIIIALRDALKGTTLNHLVAGSKITVDMEYPMTVEKYPGIWVQFSFSEIQQAGISWEMLNREVIPATDTEDEWVNWEPVKEVIFKGRATLTVVALTSLERDRIADGVISMLAFSRVPEHVITKASKDTKQFRQLIKSLAENPYISMTLNHDVIIPGGQAMTTGVPWQNDLPAYEDSYSFDLEGQTNILFANDGTYSLRRINLVPQMLVPHPYEWQ